MSNIIEEQILNSEQNNSINILLNTNNNSNNNITNLNHTKLLDIFDKLIKMTTKCTSCSIDTNFKYKQHRTQQSPTNCCVNASSISILIRLYLLNPDITFDKNFSQIFPKIIRFPNYNKYIVDYDHFFIGISNCIGLLWDKHEDDPKLLEKRSPCGLNYALNNNQEEWFNTDVKLIPGINLISFYTNYTDSKKITAHHSFIYVYDDICYLIDSWFGKKKETDIIFSKFSRPLLIRRYSLDHLQTCLDIINIINLKNPSCDEKLKIYKIYKFLSKNDYQHDYCYKFGIFIKNHIFFHIFKAPNGAKDDYYYLSCIQLKNQVLDEIINQGFDSDTSMFGGNNKYLKYKNKYIQMKV